MAAKNRAALINQALKVLKKHFKPTAPIKDRNVLDTLIVACCVENSPQEAADKAFDSLKSDYFDWNEVRVSTVRELSEALKSLNDPDGTATRVKRVLQSVFETHYSFDLEPMKKQNLGVAVKQVEKYNGSTPFTVAYLVQHALGGHSIPVNPGLLESLRIVGIVTDGEAAKGQAPGLERAVPKNKGVESASLLHQLGVEMHRSPLGPTIRKVLLEIEPDCKDRLPKRVKEQAVEPAPPPPPPAPSAKPTTKSKPATAAKGAPAAAPEPPKTTKKPAVEPPAAKTSAPVKKGPAKPAAPPKKAPPAAKKAPAKPAAKKEPPKKTVKKTSAPPPKKKKAAAKPITKRKPR